MLKRKETHEKVKKEKKQLKERKEQYFQKERTKGLKETKIKVDKW